jgi:hypothetical protein
LKTLAVLLALLSGPAAAYCPPAERPPAAFDHPYPGKLVEKAVPLEQVPALCAKLTGQYNQYVSGCGFKVNVSHDGTPQGRLLEAYGLIVYPAGCAAIRRHEIAHTNGWAHNHSHSRDVMGAR